MKELKFFGGDEHSGGGEAMEQDSTSKPPLFCLLGSPSSLGLPVIPFLMTFWGLQSLCHAYASV